LRVAEFAGLGPTPFAGMMLSDLGAEVVRITRDGPPPDGPADPLDRGRPMRRLDLKSPAGQAQALEIVAESDVLLEGFRPGVMERLGLSPALCLARNPRLIYARMTGWGQSGRDAGKAGHDINYIARAGALWPMGEAGRPPPPPLNLIGDFGGGGMLVVAGILAALLSARATGRGQVVDAAMVDGSALLMTQIHGWTADGFWSESRGSNVLDGAAYFYRTYATSDRGYMAVGAIEPQFHAALIAGLGLPQEEFHDQMAREHWAGRSARLETIFASRTRDAWEAHFEPLDACVTAVLTPTEAFAHPANQERGVFFTSPSGICQASPAPRFSQTVGARAAGQETISAQERLAAWGIVTTP
jgi:alpha-methylacyl-CoA racemase